jgi:NtrC-family two-component system response regulator AlgB
LIELSLLPSQVGKPGRWTANAAEQSTSLHQLEAEHIRRTLASTTTIDEAATKLGINPSTLYRKRRRYGIVTRSHDAPRVTPENDK